MVYITEYARDARLIRLQCLFGHEITIDTLMSLKMFWLKRGFEGFLLRRDKMKLNLDILMFLFSRFYEEQI